MTTPRISRLSAGLTIVLLLYPFASRAQQPSGVNVSPNSGCQGGKIRVVAGRHWSVPSLEPGVRRLAHASRNRAQRPPAHHSRRRSAAGTGLDLAHASGRRRDSLHFVAIHPKFAQNQLVYVSYPKRRRAESHWPWRRGRLSGAKLTDVQEIFVADAWETGGNLAGRVLLHSGCLALRDRRRSRPHLLQRHRRQQSPDEGSEPGQSRRKDAAAARRRHGAARQSVCRPRRRQARDLHLWPPQRLRPGGQSRNGRVVASRNRSHGRRRSEHSAAWPQLWLAAGVHGAQLHRHAGFRSALGAARHGQSAHSLGALHQPVQHHLLHRRQISEMEEQPVRRLADRSSSWCASRFTSRRKPSSGRDCSSRCISAFATSRRVPTATSTSPRKRRFERQRRRWRRCCESSRRISSRLLSDHVRRVPVVLFADALDEIRIRFQAPGQFDGPRLGIRLRIVDGDLDVHVPDLRPRRNVR